MPLAPRAAAPPVPGADFSSGPTVLFFYKVTCPVCQLAAPKVSVLERAYPGRSRGVGQDPPEKLAEFAREHALAMPAETDPPPHALSGAYGIRVVPTAVLVGADGRVDRVVESWDRDGLNDLSRRVAELTGRPYVPVSEASDGLPPFRPG